MSLTLSVVRPSSLGGRFSRCLRAELRKTLATSGTRWVLGVLLATWVITAAGIASVTLLGGSGEVNVMGALLGMTAFVITLGPLIGIMVMAGDWQTRDIITVFSLEPRRHIVFWSKVIAVLVVGTALIGTAVALAIAFSLILAAVVDVPVRWTLLGTNAAEMMVGAIVAILSGIAYGAAIPRVAVVVVFSLLQGLLIDPLLSIESSGIGTWFRLTAIADFSGGNGGIGPALAAVGIFLVLPAVLGLLRFLRSDVR